MAMPAWKYDRPSHRAVLKSPPLRLPGQSLDERISELQEDFGNILVLPTCLTVLTVFEWTHWMTGSLPNPWVLTSATLLSIAYAWKKGKPLPERIGRLRFGLEGERAVGQMLECLRDKGYRVFHDIPGPGFNIDHVLVGPAGVFTIETKTKSKPRDTHKIYYDGKTLRIGDQQVMDAPLAQARAQARWLTDQLNVGRKSTLTARPVVVFPEWYVVRTEQGNRSDVWVLNPKELKNEFGSILDQEPSILSADLIDAAAHSITQYVCICQSYKATA